LGPKHLSRSVVDRLALSPLACTRDLTLVSLRGHGLRRLGATQGNLIEPGPDEYPATVRWGAAAYALAARADGMIWVSRQFPGGLALMLFGDRVGRALQPDGDTLPLAAGLGFEYLARAANAAGVVLVSP
jgi:RES domain